MKFDLRLRLTNFMAAIYLAPISNLVAAWWGNQSRWRSGFVVRILCLGFVVRWGYNSYPEQWDFDGAPH